MPAAHGPLRAGRDLRQRARRRRRRGPGGIFMLDHDTFDVLGRWEIDRGAQQLPTTSGGTSATTPWSPASGAPRHGRERGGPGDSARSQYGHHLHFWDLRERKRLQTLDLGKEHQLIFELRPAHDPTKAYGFVNTVVSLNDLSPSSCSGTATATSGREEGHHHSRRAGRGGPAASGPESFKAVPPLVTDIELSVDDQFLYVSCWGTGDLMGFDVSDPFNPKLTGKVRIGGIASRAAHPAAN